MKMTSKLYLLLLAAAMLVATVLAQPDFIRPRGVRTPKFCMTRCDRKVEYCDNTCKTQYGEDRLGEDPYSYKRCLNDCAMSYLVCLNDC